MRTDAVPVRSDHIAAMQDYPSLRERLRNAPPKLRLVAPVSAPQTVEMIEPVVVPDTRPGHPGHPEFIGPIYCNRLPIWDRILIDVAREHDLLVKEMLGPRRHVKIVWPRQLAMYRIWLELKWSFPRIGRLFGNRDHTTVLHAVRKMHFLHTGELLPSRRDAA